MAAATGRQVAQVVLAGFHQHDPGRLLHDAVFRLGVGHGTSWARELHSLVPRD